MEPLTLGAVVEAVVTRLEPYGARVEAAGRTGLVLIPEISWGRIAHPGDALAVGQRVPVKVLLFQPNGGFTASIKHVHPERDPWFDPTLFAVGTEFDAPVARVMVYGFFFELRPEVWALLHRERWAGSLAVGDRLRVRVESSDAATRKVEVGPVAPPDPAGGAIS